MMKSTKVFATLSEANEFYNYLKGIPVKYSVYEPIPSETIDGKEVYLVNFRTWSLD